MFASTFVVFDKRLMVAFVRALTQALIARDNLSRDSGSVNAPANISVLLPTKWRAILYWSRRRAFPKAYWLQRLATLDVIGERATDLSHESPLIL